LIPALGPLLFSLGNIGFFSSPKSPPEGIKEKKTSTTKAKFILEMGNKD